MPELQRVRRNNRAEPGPPEGGEGSRDLGIKGSRGAEPGRAAPDAARNVPFAQSGRGRMSVNRGMPALTAWACHPSLGMAPELTHGTRGQVDCTRLQNESRIIGARSGSQSRRTAGWRVRLHRVMALRLEIVMALRLEMVINPGGVVCARPAISL